MTNEPLRRMNPTDDDLTRASSIWTASRAAVGRGSASASFPHFRIVGDAAARTIENGDLRTSALLAVDDAGAVVNREAQAASMAWRGLWASGNDAALGRGHATHGLTCPLNTFNAGHRYRNNWRPQIVG